MQQARDANVDLVRIWGGGIYESDDFYDLCDELGLLVWQDFLFACAAYAEEEPLRGEVVAEAREAITRLSPHPSLVLWNGGNENIWGHQDGGWTEKLNGRTWGWGYYTEVWATLTRSIHDEPLTSDSPGMRWHQKAQDGNGKLARGLLAHLPEPTSFDDWHWATSLNQARAVAFGIEHFRSLNPSCMGTIMWQLNDCWPVTSWAAIDGDGRAKPLWYAMRSAYRDRLLTVQPREGGLALVAVNDHGQHWHDSVLITRLSLDGAVLASTTVPLDLPTRGTTALWLPTSVTQPVDPAGEVLLARAENATTRAWWHFVEDVEGNLPIADLDSRLVQIDGGYRLEVTARTLTRDLAVLADRVAPDAVVDDMLVTLLPGETATFNIRTAGALHHAQLADPLVLRSANQLVTAAATVVAQP